MSSETTEQDDWSTIEINEIYLEKLKLLVHGEKPLRLAGYVTTLLSPEKLKGKERCKNCGGD